MTLLTVISFTCNQSYKIYVLLEIIGEFDSDKWYHWKFEVDPLDNVVNHFSCPPFSASLILCMQIKMVLLVVSIFFGNLDEIYTWYKIWLISFLLPSVYYSLFPYWFSHGCLGHDCELRRQQIKKTSGSRCSSRCDGLNSK